MEYIIGLCIIIVLLLLIGVRASIIAAGIFLLLCILLLFMLAMFTVSIIRLITSKRTEAAFSRIDKSPKGRFNVAYYMCSHEEYPCVFPSEPFFEKKFYPADKSHKIWLNSRKKTVFDRYAVATCIAGFVFSLALVLLLLYILFFY